MIGAKKTLVAGTAQKIASSPAGNNYTVKIITALTDLVLGGLGVTSATGYATSAAITTPGTDFQCGRDDLWAVSATGGDVLVLYAEN